MAPFDCPLCGKEMGSSEEVGVHILHNHRALVDCSGWTSKSACVTCWCGHTVDDYLDFGEHVTFHGGIAVHLLAHGLGVNDG